MSYSSCGDAVGGKVASCVPAVLMLRTDGGDCAGGMGPALAIGTLECAGASPDSVERSSGAPTSRPPGAPTGGSLPGFSPAFWIGAAAASLPSTRGVPGASGWCAGSNTSERLPGTAPGGGLDGPCGDIARGG